MEGATLEGLIKLVHDLQDRIKQYESEDDHEAMSCYLQHNENAKLRSVFNAANDLVTGPHKDWDDTVKRFSELQKAVACVANGSENGK